MVMLLFDNMLILRNVACQGSFLLKNRVRTGERRLKWSYMTSCSLLRLHMGLHFVIVLKNICKCQIASNTFP